MKFRWYGLRVGRLHATWYDLSAGRSYGRKWWQGFCWELSWGSA